MDEGRADTDGGEARHLRMQIFDIQGNRFVHPYYGYIEEDPDSGGFTDLWAKSLLLRLSLRAETQEGDAGFLRLRLPVGEDGHFELPHVKIDVSSPAFAHGGATFLCIDGPLFDEAMARQGDPTGEAE